MGIYYCAICEETKEKFEPPKMFSIKSPGFFHPTSPFPGMFTMMNYLGYNYKIINDMVDDDLYYDDQYKDITNEVYERYLNWFPWAKDEIYECKD